MRKQQQPKLRSLRAIKSALNAAENHFDQYCMMEAGQLLRESFEFAKREKEARGELFTGKYLGPPAEADRRSPVDEATLRTRIDMLRWTLRLPPMPPAIDFSGCDGGPLPESGTVVQ